MNHRLARTLCIFAATFSLARFVAAQSDTTPPQLVSLDFTPKSVDVTSAAQVVTLTMHVTDDISGLNQINVSFAPPHTQVIEVFANPATARTSGTANDGVYRVDITIPKGSEAGTWELRNFLRDQAGNFASYPYSPTPFPPGTPSQLTVINGAPTPTPTPTPIPTPPPYTGPRWPAGKNIEIELNIPTNIHYPSGGAQGNYEQTGPLEGASYQDAVMTNIAEWNLVMRDVKMTAVPVKPGSAPPTLGDGRNTIYFDYNFGGPDYSYSYVYNPAYNPPIDPNHVQATQYDQIAKTYVKTDANGNIEEVDIALNGNLQRDGYFEWDCWGSLAYNSQLSTSPAFQSPVVPNDPNIPPSQWPFKPRYDLKREILHQLGHLLGLGNIDNTIGGTKVHQMMNTAFATDADQAQQNPDGQPWTGCRLDNYDAQAIQALYGNPFVKDANGIADLRSKIRLVNVATRMGVGKDDNVLIAGFIIENQNNKQLKLGIRGMGPSLGNSGIQGALQDPTLEIYSNSGTKLASNDNWQTTQINGLITADQSGDIAAAGLAPSNPKESVVIVTLGPGAFTAIVRGAGNTTGTGLVEVYQLDNGGMTTWSSTDDGAKLINLSTRGQVLAGEQVMIAGMIVQGNTSKKVAVRAIGPSLSNAGVSGALQNPVLNLYDSNGTAISSNDDWQVGQQAADIAQPGLAPQNSKEAAIVAMLAPGNYTAIVSGFNDTTGVGLVEVYDLDPEGQLAK